jgi:hypothetical protein
MIINQDDGLSVPEKTIAVFPTVSRDKETYFDMKKLSLFLKPLNTTHERYWFTPHFYKCLPLSIGNMQGFVFSLPYSFKVAWNGGDRREDVQVWYGEDVEQYKEKLFIHAVSEFGSGILTIHFPVTLKTPPGVNLMTIAPPNFPVPGMSPMTGVVESDNLRFTFTLNLKIDLVDTLIEIEANAPLAGIIPIPRYFCDSFELKSAYDIFDKEIIDEEIDTGHQHDLDRSIHNHQHLGPDKKYFMGYDYFGNKFKDHQLPKKKKLTD